MSGMISITGLAALPPMNINATIATIAATMITGTRMRMTGTGAGRVAAGTASALNDPRGRGGAGSRCPCVSG
ncbi:hypothetical protein [Corynebacterium maris]|uniref:hypothetical protein n=1 Tax=Corynebacterium maris TaxID=575200 RepID=UPI00146C5FD6|nr:hypothetical protein [Corynebacterium maris]